MRGAHRTLFVVVVAVNPAEGGGFACTLVGFAGRGGPALSDGQEDEQKTDSARPPVARTGPRLPPQTRGGEV